MQEHKTIDKIMIKILFSVFTILFTVFIMPIITNRDFGVRIDIWTHFMRGCIIDYVH